MVLTHGIPDFGGGGVHSFIFKLPDAIGPVPSLSGHAIAYQWRLFTAESGPAQGQ